MIKQESEWAWISGSSSLLTVQLVEHSVRPVAESFQKEKPVWNWDVAIFHVGSEFTKENEERSCGEEETKQSD